MNARAILNAMVVVAGFAAVASSQAQVVISAVYGGGGNAGATVRNDFIELRNRTNAPVNVTGWSVRYAAATGSNWTITNLTGTIPANGFYLVRQSAGGNTTIAELTPFDASGTASMSGTAGKVALVTNQTAFSVFCPDSTLGVIDFVGYNSPGATGCSETAPTAALSNTTGAIRNSNGCTDTGSNLADFTVSAVGTVTGQFLPRGTGSPAGASCGAVIVDCNNNGIPDATDIANTPSIDCNLDGIIDSCQITSAIDCNANTIIDSCEINSNGGSGGVGGTLDINSNGIIDSCEGTPLTSIIISEVVDGSLANGLPKFVELTNISTTTAVTFGSNDFLRLYANGSLIATQNTALNGVTILPGASYTVANNGGGTTLPPVGWLQAYGVSNFPSAYGTVTFFNGDDAIRLERGTTIIDSFGVVGEGSGGSGTIAWGYEDSFARRKPTVCVANVTFTASEWILPGNNALERAIINNSPAQSFAFDVYVNNLAYQTSPNAHANVCNGRVNDCNGNNQEDSLDITGFNFADCNGNLVPDTCDLVLGALDCNANGLIDSCEIIAGTVLDVNLNGRPDSCDPFLFDCNNNGIEDATDVANGAPDCNNNLIPDSCEPLLAIDTDNNGTPDICEGAFVAETIENATVQTAGVRVLANGAVFFNIQGSGFAANASYGGLRYDITAMATQFDAAFGAGNWTVDKVLLRLTQANAGFTAPGPIDIFQTNNDTLNFTPAATVLPPVYPNFATDFADRQPVVSYTFATTGNVNSGTVETYTLFDAAGSNLAGGTAAAAEIQSAGGKLSLVLREGASTVAATYAGNTNITFAGPTIVVFVTGANACPACPADYNQDGGVTGDDIAAFFADFEAGGGCADTNVDGGITGDDIAAFFTAFEAGGC